MNHDRAIRQSAAPRQRAAPQARARTACRTGLIASPFPVPANAPTLGPEIARAAPEVRATVEEGLKRLQKSWSARIGDPDAAWALIAQCVGALVLSRAVESERTRKEILASSRRFIDETHALDEKPARLSKPS